MSVFAWIDHHFRSGADRLCLSAPDGDLTYGEVDEITGELAGRLTAHGVVPGELVAVDAPRSTLGVCLALAIWRAGAAFLLFDPVQPELRRKEILTDARVRLRVRTEEGDVVIDDLGAPAEGGDDLAYVVYTSGSTGTPKGVLCRHSSLPPILEMARGGFGITPADRVAMLAPFHVEGVVFELLAALAIGGSLHLPGPDLTDFLREREITVLVGTPTRLADLDPRSFPALRLVISAGEDLPPGLARRWAAGRRLINSYGVTEATIASTFTVVPPDVTRVPIGLPIPHAVVLLLDEDGRPVPPGLPGELYLGGPGVSAGYLDRPELTADRFVDVDGERMYRTGDHAESDVDGVLYFLGRQDGQVQLGGYRVEPGEVRVVLHGHPAVRDCAVVARDQRLIAYVVGERAEPAELRSWLAERLPAYQIPARFVLLGELPKTDWGKVDLRALPDPGGHDAAPVEGGPVEVAVHAAAAAVLGTASFGLDDDLFLIGLTSILVAKLIQRIGADLAVTLSPVDVFEHPTAGELAAVVTLAKAST